MHTDHRVVKEGIGHHRRDEDENIIKTQVSLPILQPAPELHGQDDHGNDVCGNGGAVQTAPDALEGRRVRHLAHSVSRNTPTPGQRDGRDVQD